MEIFRVKIKKVNVQACDCFGESWIRFLRDRQTTFVPCLEVEPTMIGQFEMHDQRVRFMQLRRNVTCRWYAVASSSATRSEKLPLGHRAMNVDMSGLY